MKDARTQIASESWQAISDAAEQLVAQFEAWHESREEDTLLSVSWLADDDLERAVDNKTRDRLLFERLENEDRLPKEDTEDTQVAIGVTALANAIERVRSSTAKQDKEQLVQDLEDLSAASDHVSIKLDDALGRMLELTALVDLKDARLIYTPPEPEIILPEIIIPAREDLLEKIRRSPAILFSISPRAFEELIAEIFERRGFQVRLTKQTRDGGLDIVAIQSVLGIKTKYIVECKRYAKENKVTLDLVQRLYGVKLAQRANKAILVTTSSFTKDAVRFANKHLWDLTLSDCTHVLKWIKATS